VPNISEKKRGPAAPTNNPYSHSIFFKKNKYIQYVGLGRILNFEKRTQSIGNRN